MVSWYNDIQLQPLAGYRLEWTEGYDLRKNNLLLLNKNLRRERGIFHYLMGKSHSIGEWIRAVSTEVEWVNNLKSSKIAVSDYEKKVRILWIYNMLSFEM